ncbi:MAG TPA: hypothetical protein VFP54_08445 [Acidimicrobiales bacterium]|nr:hypothetical protein [Acidimicrobiales bacterium]
MANADILKTSLLRATILCSQMVRAVRARVVVSASGEGVVSLAIGVLIMAFLGAILWVAFKTTLSSATTNVSHQVSQIGN